jgi:hypothetical protein
VIAWRIEQDQTKDHYSDNMLVAIGIDSTSAEPATNVYSAVLAPDGVVWTNRVECRRYDSVEQWQKAAKQHFAEAEKERQARMRKAMLKEVT